MSQATIRKARPGDEKGIHESHMRSIREVCVKDHGENEIKGWGNRPLGNRWVDAIKDGHVWVVEHNNQIFGHAYIRIYSENGEQRAHVLGLYLTPEMLGKGFGIKLVQLMLEKAKDSGVKSVTLESTITAHDFYKSVGFVDSGPMMKHEIGGYPVSCFPMALKIAE